MNKSDFEKHLIEYVVGELPPDVTEQMNSYIRESPEAAILERDFRMILEAGTAIRTNDMPLDLMPKANAKLLNRLRYQQPLSIDGGGKAAIHVGGRKLLRPWARPLWRPISVCGIGALLVAMVAIPSGRKLIAQVAEFATAKVVHFGDQGQVISEQSVPNVEVNGAETILHFEDGSIDTFRLDRNPPDRLITPEEEKELLEHFRGKSAAIIIYHSNVAGKTTTTSDSLAGPAEKSWSDIKADTTNSTSK